MHHLLTMEKTLAKRYVFIITLKFTRRTFKTFFGSYRLATYLKEQDRIHLEHQKMNRNIQRLHCLVINHLFATSLYFWSKKLTNKKFRQKVLSKKTSSKIFLTIHDCCITAERVCKFCRTLTILVITIRVNLFVDFTYRKQSQIFTQISLISAKNVSKIWFYIRMILKVILSAEGSFVTIICRS